MAADLARLAPRYASWRNSSGPAATLHASAADAGRAASGRGCRAPRRSVRLGHRLAAARLGRRQPRRRPRGRGNCRPGPPRCADASGAAAAPAGRASRWCPRAAAACPRRAKEEPFSRCRSDDRQQPGPARTARRRIEHQPLAGDVDRRGGHASRPRRLTRRRAAGGAQRSRDARRARAGGG